MSLKDLTPDEFIEFVTPEAIKACNEGNFKIVSLPISQSGLESGYGESSLAWKYNNLLGRKYSTNNVITKRYVSLKTKEWKIDHYITIYSKFCVYETIADCFRDYIWLLHNAKLSNGNLRYLRVLNSKNYIEATQAIKDCGYATSPNYPTSLRNIITKYQLNNYDK